MAWAGAPYLGVAAGPESQKGEEACVTGWHYPSVPPSGRDGTRGPRSEEVAQASRLGLVLPTFWEGRILWGHAAHMLPTVQV